MPFLFQVAKEHIKGYIYIEAFKQTHVKQVIEGVGNLRLGRWKQHMVPIKEMTDVLKVCVEKELESFRRDLSSLLR